MKLKLHPIIDEMKEFYHQPLGSERFSMYLEKLQGGSKGDLKLPIGGFNPMAKEHVLVKLEELENVEAEKVILEVIDLFNHKNETKDSQEITIVLNLADDLKGGWTNRYVTDYESKFKINAIATRYFCTPYFWSSEGYNKELIWSRTMKYAYRTMYWLEYGRITTLEDHLNQEVFVFKMTRNFEPIETTKNLELTETFYKANSTSEDYSLIFNFFYGDEGSNVLGYPLYGNGNSAGFNYAAKLALEME